MEGYISMKTKTMIIVFVLLAAAITNITAAPGPGKNKLGFGAQFNFDAEDLFSSSTEDKYSPLNIALVLSPSRITHIAVNWHIDDRANAIGLTFDVCPLALPLVSSKTVSLNFTLGGGFYVDMEFADKHNKHKKAEKTETEINGGLRIPAGFSLMLGRNAFEIYIHIAPSFGVNFMPTLEFSDLFFPVALGARFWFN